jgi:FkbM family methyltransferase
MRRKLQFWYIRLHRYLLKTKFLPVMGGPLKGLLWTTSMNYEYLTGSYIGDDEVEVLARVLNRPDPVFYDIGANVGYFSVTVSRLFPHSVIYAFEPMPEHLQTLQDHLQLNAIGNVLIEPLAISDKTGDLEFSGMQGSEGNTYKNESALFQKAGNSFKVKGTSVDDFIAAGNRVPNFLKIDVEGAELDVLHGALHTIRMYRPAILLATHDCHLAGIKDKCVEFLQAEGYSLEGIGAHNKHVAGLEDFIAMPADK